jgi:hypothetical protein
MRSCTKNNIERLVPILNKQDMLDQSLYTVRIANIQTATTSRTFKSTNQTMDSRARHEKLS